jgi:hypothetical protein
MDSGMNQKVYSIDIEVLDFYEGIVSRLSGALANEYLFLFLFHVENFYM